METLIHCGIIKFDKLRSLKKLDKLKKKKTECIHNSKRY